MIPDVVRRLQLEAVSRHLVDIAPRVPDGLTEHVLERAVAWSRCRDADPRDVPRVLAGHEIRRREPVDFGEIGTTAGTSKLTRVIEPAGVRCFTFSGERLTLPNDFQRHCEAARVIKLGFHRALGGCSDVMEQALAILVAAHERGARVHAHVADFAGSADAYLWALSPGRRTMAPSAKILIHGGHLAVFGDAGQLREAAMRLEADDEATASRLAVRCGRSTAEVRQWMRSGQDSVFDAGAAVLAGLADSIMEE